MKRIEGIEAIEYATLYNKTLCKYTDTTEEAREGLTVDEAREIASEDPGLVYLDIDFGLKEAREILENMDELDYDELEPMYEWFIGSPLVDGGEPGETLTEYDMYSELCQALEVFE